MQWPSTCAAIAIATAKEGMHECIHSHNLFELAHDTGCRCDTVVLDQGLSLEHQFYSGCAVVGVTALPSIKQHDYIGTFEL